jgi:hypothetical protein
MLFIKALLMVCLKTIWCGKIQDKEKSNNGGECSAICGKAEEMKRPDKVRNMIKAFLNSIFTSQTL